MTTLHPDTVAIRQLRLRSGTGAGSARMAQEAARLRQDLEWADWPDAPGESWVFIRRLHAKASRGQAVQHLVQNARQLVYSGSDDNLVRFASLVDLLTALLRDLTHPGTSRPWYWQRWAHLFALPRPRAVADLLTEHLAHLPSVCARLARHGALEHIWMSLDEEQARRVQHALAWRGGFSPPQGVADQSEQGRTGHVSARGVELDLSPAVRMRWQPLLQRLSVADARYQLGLLVIAQEVAPLILQRAPAALLNRLHNIILSRDTLPRAATPAAGSVSQSPQPLLQPQEDAPSIADTANAAATINETPGDFPRQATPGKVDPTTMPPSPSPTAGKTRPEPRSFGATPDTAAGAYARLLPVDETIRHQGDPSADQPTLPVFNPSQRLRLQDQDLDLAFDQFHTRQGGVLYLLNILNRSEMQFLMEKWWQQLPNGWGWLYRLGQELQLDETDPICTFLATQLGFDHRTELERLPPLPARTELLELAGRWYGPAALWQPGLLHLTARVRFTPSHVDMYLPLNAVQLPVRLAGLDINPGWLPWLGRVVTFYYD